MLIFIVSFISLTIFLFKSLTVLQHHLQLSILFVQSSLSLLVLWFKACLVITIHNLDMTQTDSLKRRCNNSKIDSVEETDNLSILDLPDLTLECILAKLSPAGLSNMAAVCSSLREKCRSDYMWEQHMTEKWGKFIGHAAKTEWKLFLCSTRESASLGNSKVQSKWLGVLSCVWPISLLKFKIYSGIKTRSFAPDGSVMSWYQSLESGKFWFPAQVYNRENGHVGFMLSCYDAEVSYDRHTDTFRARYPPHGRRTIVIEEGVHWDRLRAPPIDTPAHELHVTDCLNELHPGDHIEIQWRRNKEFPYGWWYGAVGHLESCDGNEHFCRCYLSDTVILEFNQYTPGSRWRRASINRKDHTEAGNETDGFYGGIRKLKGADEIAKWKQLWPTDILE